MSKAPWSARYRFWIIAAWVILIIASAPVAMGVTKHLSSGGFEAPGSQAVWADNRLKLLNAPASSSPHLIQHWSPTGRTLSIPTSWLHRVANVGYLLLVPAGTATSVTDSFLATVRSEGGRTTAVTESKVGSELSTDSVSTLHTSTAIALPILALLLLIVFGSIASAALPILIAIVGSVLSLAVISVLETHITLSIYLTDIVTFLALGVGVDYALFISSRFRQALAEGLPTDQAVSLSMKTAGRSVFFSGLAVALALATLLLGGTTYWHGLALGGAVAVVAVLLATHTLLPALLSYMGKGVLWGKLPHFERLRAFWPALARFGTKFPAIAMLVGVAILVVPAILGPQFSMKVPANLSSMLPRSSVLRQATQVEQQVLGSGALTPFPVVIEMPTTVTETATWDAIATVTRRLKGLTDVRGVSSPTSLGLPAARLASAVAHPNLAPAPLRKALRNFVNPSADSHLVVLYVTARTGPDASATQSLFTRMKSLLPTVVPAGGRVGVGGTVGVLAEFNAYMNTRLTYIIGAVALVALLVLLFATGSVPQAVVGVLMSALVALATAGILVYTIQQGHFGLEPQSPNTAIAPLIFVLLFGLSMDYEVILLHRVQEALSRGESAREAARHGIAMTGSMITGAGIIMVTVFLVLLASPLELLKTLGIGMTAALLLDTWIVRTFLIPGNIVLFGKAAFWPWGVARVRYQPRHLKRA